MKYNVTLLALLIFVLTQNANAQISSVWYTFNGPNGAKPVDGMTVGPDGKMYGTTSAGGEFGFGTVFQLTTNGSVTTLYNFDNTNGNCPSSRLTWGPDGKFYGLTELGGDYDYGTVFSVTTNGVLQTLVSWEGFGPVAWALAGTAESGLTVGADGRLYGATYVGGAFQDGNLFVLTTNGTFTWLADFDGTNGSFPNAKMILAPDGNLYGATWQGGTYGDGTIFRLSTNGSFTTLVNFDGTNGSGPDSLALGPDGNLYGVTQYPGHGGADPLFRLTTNGDFTVLPSFNPLLAKIPNAEQFVQANGNVFALSLGPDGNFYCLVRENPVFYLFYWSLWQATTNGTMHAWAGLDDTESPSLCPMTLGPDNNFYGLNNTIALWDQWYGNPNGNIFQISNILAPVFWGLTFDQSAVIGDSATFSSKADGLPPFAYQWYFNGQLLAGATNENLIISHVNNGEAGTYTLVATNTYGCATSPPSLLGVQLQPNCYAISNWDNGNLAIYFASHPSTANRLWATTNLALGQWQVVSTNIMDTNGLSQFIDTNTPGAFQKFYRLSYP